MSKNAVPPDGASALLELTIRVGHSADANNQSWVTSFVAFAPGGNSLLKLACFACLPPISLRNDAKVQRGIPHECIKVYRSVLKCIVTYPNVLKCIEVY